MRRFLLGISLAVLSVTPLVAFGLVVSAVPVFAQTSPSCPDDDSGSYFTGRTKTGATGRLLKEYKCYSFGHLFWVRAS